MLQIARESGSRGMALGTHTIGAGGGGLSNREPESYNIILSILCFIIHCIIFYLHNLHLYDLLNMRQIPHPQWLPWLQDRDHFLSAPQAAECHRWCDAQGDRPVCGLGQCVMARLWEWTWIANVYIISYSVVLCFIVLYYFILYYIVFYSIVLYFIILY